VGVGVGVGEGEGDKTKEGQKPINTLAERTTNNGHQKT
jgi:hypothetical protein